MPTPPIGRNSRVLRAPVPMAAPVTAALAAWALAACNAAVPPSYSDPTPEARIGAIRETVSQGRRQDIPRLIECLSSDDPAVRLAAIEALRSLTGTTQGYRASAPPADRTAAIATWKSWAIEQGMHPAQPAE